MGLLLQNVSLPLAEFDLELNVETRGPVTAIFGPSGAGKTSLLDLVAGLRRPRSAFIQLDQQVLSDTATGVWVPARRRGIGYVPQDLALFPHLSVRSNLLYGHQSGGPRQFGLDAIVELLELQALVPRPVTGLSGGERQRVALGRALLAAPRLLLLDEPLASLDAALKSKILPYLARIRDRFRIPMLYVTHDRRETLALADEMVVLVQGRVAQVGAVPEVFSRPANLAVAGLLAIETVVPGRVVQASQDLVTVAVGSALLTAVDPNLPPGAETVHVCIRAEDVILLKGADTRGSPRNHLSATVLAVTRDGPLMRIDLAVGELRLAALLTRQACDELGLRPQDPVVAWIKAPNVHLIPR